MATGGLFGGAEADEDCWRITSDHGSVTADDIIIRRRVVHTVLCKDHDDTAHVGTAAIPGLEVC